jgi:hypothetical protein
MASPGNRAAKDIEATLAVMAVLVESSIWAESLRKGMKGLRSITLAANRVMVCFGME